MTKISCEIIKDLLPLYHDGVCSDQSKQLIEEHLEECETCRAELAQIAADIQMPPQQPSAKEEGTAIKNIALHWSKSKLRAFVKGVIIAAAVCGAALGVYYGLFCWQIVNVSSDVIEISNVCKMADGRIAYNVRLTDGYDLNYVRFENDGKGNFYFVPLRPVIKHKAITQNGLHNTYDEFDIAEYNANGQEKGIDVAITAVYYGSPDDCILIWKQGMELPAASSEVENMFNYDNVFVINNSQQQIISIGIHFDDQSAGMSNGDNSPLKSGEQVSFDLPIDKQTAFAIEVTLASGETITSQSFSLLPNEQMNLYIEDKDNGGISITEH